MPRPPKKNLDYFPHDCRASSDEKLEIFEIKYPNGLGYAWYFKTLERVYFHEGKFDVSEAETKQILCRNLNVDSVEILEYAIKIGLFDKNEYDENGVITSKRIKSNVKPILGKRKKMALQYEKRVSASEIPPETGEETHIVKESKRKVKERKDIYNESFLLFWDEYPRRVGKGNAFKAWVKIKDDKQNIISAAKSYSEQCVKDKADDQFIPHPATWLNGRRWEDETKPITRNIPTRMIQ